MQDNHIYNLRTEIFSLFWLSLLFQNPLEQVTLYRVGDFYLGCIAGYFFMRSDLGGVKYPSWLWSLLEIAVVLLLLPLQLIHDGSMKFISDDAVRNDLLYTFPVMSSVYLGALQSDLSRNLFYHQNG